MKTMVLYHANCADGFCAAFVLYRYFPDAEFIPVQYGQEPPDVTGASVFIVDFSYPIQTLLSMNEVAEEVLVLDHHLSAKNDLEELPFAIFDMNKSGARITHDWMVQSTGDEKAADAKWLIDYTEDRDLWNWKLLHSKEVSAAIASYPQTFDAWERLVKMDSITVAREGEAILRYQNQVVEKAVENAREIMLDGHAVLAVNCTTMISEVAGKLAEGRPFGVCWFQTKEGSYVYSLRSRDQGLDVSVIAKKYGGGGHRNAAGFKLERMVF